MQPSRPRCRHLSPNAVPSWQRLCLCLCTLLIMLTLLISLVGTESAYARHAPNRRDRRPDRETRIRYPRANSSSGSNRNSNSTIHSAPPTASPSNAAPAGDQPTNNE